MTQRTVSPAPPEETAPTTAWLQGLAWTAIYLAVCSAPVFILTRFGPGAAALVGIALTTAWLKLMPTTCMGGGFLWSLLAMQQFALLLLWGSVAVYSLVD